MIEYTSPEGYTGQLYGKSSYRIVDKYGKEVFYTGYRTINTFEELKADIDEFPVILAKLIKTFKH